MARQEASNDNLPLESSLMDLILNPKSEKIRRPPNAFMLFARDHRRIISKQHPDVSNKVVSSMLGKIWKDTVRDVKEKYYNKAKILGELHKRHYPDYVYSPREARIQKMNKKKRKDEANSADTATQREDSTAVRELIRREDNSNEEEWISDTNNEPKSSPEYIPNNPEYFAEQSPEIIPEEDEALDLRPGSGYSNESQYHQEFGELPLHMDQGWTEKNCRRPKAAKRCGCCNQNRLGLGVRCVPPYEKRESEGVIPHFSDRLPCSYATDSPFCNPPPHFTGPMSSYCCVPRRCTSPIQRPYGPPLQAFWNPSIINSPCYSGREYFYEDLKPYPFSTPYRVPDFYGPFGYFDRPFTQPKKNLDSSFHPHLREGLELPRRSQNGLETDNAVPYSYFGRSDEREESSHHSFDGNSRLENERTLQNRRILRSDMKNKEQIVHQNQVNGTEIKPQDSSSPHMCMPINEEGSLLAERRHFSNHLYPNFWDSHSSGNKSLGMISTDPVLTEQYQYDLERINGNINSSELANNCQRQSEDLLNPIVSPESHKRKLDALHSEGNDHVISNQPKRYRLSIIPTSEAATPHLWSSTIMKSPLTKNKNQEVYNKPATTLDQPFYSNSENNSITSTNKHLSNPNKISPDFFIATQDKNSSGNIIVDKQGVPLNLSFSKVPIQIAKECPSGFDSSNLEKNQIQRKNHISVNVQPSQLCEPLVKMEFNGQDIYSINEIDEKNLETNDDKNNQQNNTFKMEHETFVSTTEKHQNINSIKGDRANIETNSFVIRNNAENVNVRPHILANVTSHVHQSNMTDNSRYDLSKAYFETVSQPVTSQENYPGIYPSSQTIASSNGVTDHGIANSNLPVLQPFIKMEDNGNSHILK